MIGRKPAELRLSIFPNGYSIMKILLELLGILWPWVNYGGATESHHLLIVWVKN